MLAGCIAYDLCPQLCRRCTFRLMPLVDNELLYRPYTLGELYDVSAPALAPSTSIHRQRPLFLHKQCRHPAVAPAVAAHPAGRHGCAVQDSIPADIRSPINPALKEEALSSTGYAGVPAE